MTWPQAFVIVGSISAFFGGIALVCYVIAKYDK